MTAARLTPDELELLADLVADRLAALTMADRLVDTRAVAAFLGVEPSFVYEHSVELGARRLGSGPKAPLRFSLREVDERLHSCSASRGSDAAVPPVMKPNQRRRSSARLGTGVELLPIRGAPRAR